jgi:hypothetical protein
VPIIDFIGETKPSHATCNPVSWLGRVEHREAACWSINANITHGAVHGLDDVTTLAE